VTSAPNEKTLWRGRARKVSKLGNWSLQFLGATGTVTGSKYLLRAGDDNVLVDCGLFQGLKQLRLRNWAPLPLNPAAVSAVVLSHAHLDHSGYLPLLVRNGFAGKIYCSEATYDLCCILLPDSGRLQEEEAEYANRQGFSKHKPALPLYTEEDAKRSLARFAPVEFGGEIGLGRLRLRLVPAGQFSVRLSSPLTTARAPWCSRGISDVRTTRSWWRRRRSAARITLCSSRLMETGATIPRIRG
jgi:hypothetical protein